MSGNSMKRALIGHLPAIAPVDHLVHLFGFVMQHRRLPRRRHPLFNDVIHRIKASTEIVDPLRVYVTDKEFVKTFVRDRVGDEHNVPTHTVFRRVDDVDIDLIPDRCVIKPTHASGQIVTRKHGEPVDMARIRGWFALNYYRTSRERNYKNLQPKVIVEPLIFNDAEITDYKVFCFHGRPRLIQVDYGRHSRHVRKFYDLDWREQGFGLVYERGSIDFERPANLDRMLQVATRLSQGFSLVRVDMYSDGESVLIGEMTNCPSGAMGVFSPPDGERLASAMIFGDLTDEMLHTQVA